MDRHLLVRAASVYIAVVLTAVACAKRRPTGREVTGAVLGFMWNLPVLLALNLASIRFAWWHFDARGGLLAGVPVDLYLAWAWLWGAVPALFFRSLPLTMVIALAFAFDLALMPAAEPVVRLGTSWLAGECVGLALGVLPGQALARWTMRDERLAQRAVLQIVAFAGLTTFVVPIIAIDASGAVWPRIDWRTWQVSLGLQMLALPVIIGLSAVQEFVTRGRGTPFPYDPPRQLVTSGLYAYVRNPMQIAGIAILALIGFIIRSPWIAAAGVLAHVFVVGLARWDEEVDLGTRFGDRWTAYRRSVRNWIPRIRPWAPPRTPPSRLYVASTCAMCSDVGRWLGSRHASGLAILPGEEHPTRQLTRITYEPGDEGPPSSGIEALARALEHVHLGWALVAALLRLPVVLPVVQLIADASGAGPREIGRQRAVAAPTGSPVDV